MPTTTTTALHIAPQAPATVDLVSCALSALEAGDARPYARLCTHQKQEAAIMAASCGYGSLIPVTVPA